MLKDVNGAVILENSIHTPLQTELRDPTQTPPDIFTHLQHQRLREKADQAKKAKSTAKGAKMKGEEKTVEDLLGMDYATHTKFWYDHAKKRPPMKIRNPLEVDLSEFAAFAPFADAVALRPH